MHEVLVNRSGGLSLPRKSVVRLTDRPYMTLDVYRGRKTTTQQQQHQRLQHILDHAERLSLSTFLLPCEYAANLSIIIITVIFVYVFFVSFNVTKQKP